MARQYLAALDQGTTSSRAIVFDLRGCIVSSCNREFKQIFPYPGWVEHAPGDILQTQIESLRSAVRSAGISGEDIAAIGIANQRETTLLWDRATGKCLYNAIVWQCRRTAPYIERLIKQGYGTVIREKTGLVPDAYFSGTKLMWLLDTLDLRERARRGELCFGTVDSYLAWHLCKGHPHVTDATNASRTMLFNLHTQEWDEELLKAMDIPRALLPEVTDTASVIGVLDESILGFPVPVASLAGDQHAALFGQACLNTGAVKNTYGTGCFMLANTGSEFCKSQNNLVTTMAWRLNGKPEYALEGSVFTGGAAIQWLRDELHMISSASQSEEIASCVESTEGVYLVPAFSGLGAPHWNMYARGMLVGLTRGSGRAHIVRAALESIAFQSADLLAAMIQDSGVVPDTLRVDGGASANNFLMQFQSDIMDIPVTRPVVRETTALGAALLAGIAVGIYRSPDETAMCQTTDKTFYPTVKQQERDRLLAGWKHAVESALYWSSRQD